jgi:hypothetical protein
MLCLGGLLLKRRRLILAWLLLLLPAAGAGLQWARSYTHRDIFLWGSGPSNGRCEVCRLYSSSGRLIFLSHTYPVAEAGAEGPVPFAFYTGNRDATAGRATEVYGQISQAGAPSFEAAGLMYSRHFASLESGEHLWTSLVVPWWMLTALALASAGWVAWRFWWRRAKNAAPQTGG